MTEEKLQKGREILNKIDTIKKHLENIDSTKEIQIWFIRNNTIMDYDVVRLGSQKYTTIRYWYERELEQLNREFEEL